MTILELKDKRSLLLDENRSVLDTIKSEMRMLNDGEKRSFDANEKSIEAFNADILKAEVELKETRNTKTVKNTIKMENNFNLLTAIRNRVEGRAFDKDTLDVIDAGKEEMRHAGVSPEGDIILPTEYRADILAGTVGAGAEVVAEDKMNILAPLRAALVMVQAGATYMTGLVGDVSIPKYAGTTAAWKGEVAPADDGGGAFTEVNLSPMRLTTYIDVSKQFLNQDSAGAEAMLKQDIVLAIAGKLESTILGAVDAVAGVNPAGFFATGYSPEFTGVVSWEDVVSLETAVDTSNALMGNLKYITNAGGRGLLKSTAKQAASGQYLLDGNEMNGYDTLVSNHVASGLEVAADEDGVIFGNFADYVIAQWGGIDLVVDPYTQAANGQVRLVVNSYWDAKPRRDESFAVASIVSA